MNICEKIKSIKFFNKRILVDQNEEDQSVSVIGYREQPGSPYSSIVYAPATTNGVLAACIMFCTDGILVKYDGNTELITIVIPKIDDNMGFVQEFPSSVDEGEFFQDTLINNYHHITYEYIEAVHDILLLSNDTK